MILFVLQLLYNLCLYKKTTTSFLFLTLIHTDKLFLFVTKNVFSKSCTSSAADYCKSENSFTKRPRDTAQRLIRHLQTLPALLHPLHLNYYFSNGNSKSTTQNRS